MTNRKRTNGGQPGNPLDAAYREAVEKYLLWLAVACLIASWHAGLVMVPIWFAVAYVLTRDGPGRDQLSGKQPCKRKRRRRC